MQRTPSRRGSSISLNQPSSSSTSRSPAAAGRTRAGKLYGWMVAVVCGVAIGVTINLNHVLHHSTFLHDRHVHELQSGFSLRSRRGGLGRLGPGVELLAGDERELEPVSIAGIWSELPDHAGEVVWTGTGQFGTDPDHLEHIPPLIHQIWDDPVVENMCQISAQSWERFCAEYGCLYKLWRRSDLEELAPFVNRKHYDTTKSPQMRADIARYEILNKHGGLYLDCDMIWAGKSRMSNSFVAMLNSAQLAITASNDIRNATNAKGMSNASLAVIFFTNRVIATCPQHPVMQRSIEITAEKLAAFKTAAADAVGTKKEKQVGKEKPFFTTGPYVMNLALQQVGDSTPTNVIPHRWIYPESLDNHEQLVMFGHNKDRSVHKNGVAINPGEGWSRRPWLMHRSMPNYFTLARQEGSRYLADDYAVQQPSLVDRSSASDNKGVVAVFVHHNKAGGTGVKVALQQLYQVTPNLSHASVFSTSACAYSAAGIARNRLMQDPPSFCNSGEWKERHLPPCGRCKAAATKDVKLGVSTEQQTPRDISPDGSKGSVGSAVCRELKRGGRCGHLDLRGKCCKTCGSDACPQVHKPKVASEVAPGGQSGDAATKRCGVIESKGQCNDPSTRGFCCATCGDASCTTASMLVGDYAMGVCKVVAANRPCAYYTMLREPRQRIASSYLHCQYEPDDQLCMTHVLDARHATFAQWVKHQGNYLLRQLQFDISMSLSIEEQFVMYIQYLKHKAQLQRLEKSSAWISKPNSAGADAAAVDVNFNRAIKGSNSNSNSDSDSNSDSNRNSNSNSNSNDERSQRSAERVGSFSSASSSSSASEFERTALAYKPNMLWLLEQQRGKPLPDVDAEIVVDSLESLFAVIGIVEKFNESLAMYQQVFGLPYVEAAQHTSREQAAQQMHVHVGEDISTRKQVQEGLVQQFKENPALDEHIKWDLRLYARALEIFKKQEKALWKMRPDLAKIYNPVARDAATKDNVPSASPGLQDWFAWMKEGVAVSLGRVAATGTPPATTQVSQHTTARSTSTNTPSAAKVLKGADRQANATGEGNRGGGGGSRESAKKKPAKAGKAVLLVNEVNVKPVADHSEDVARSAATLAGEKRHDGTAPADDAARSSSAAQEEGVPSAPLAPASAVDVLDYDEEVKMAAEMEVISLMRHAARKNS